MAAWRWQASDVFAGVGIVAVILPGGGGFAAFIDLNRMSVDGRAFNGKQECLLAIRVPVSSAGLDLAVETALRLVRWDGPPPPSELVDRAVGRRS